ncbi:uncharacterized protein A1O5_07946 [Cladophialophora psammophila CBS 110553]|uniref:polynucleotide adenylyltransferase n=1 Tax=Cladophialophora psammophila CBS 110553 TaxID=1182543 RepID=W9WWI5_9EURO|nr:uncharacterized protein A1O5_07946 [Cladophialophora psammophila CBS 110553]EXJ69011.1 hypothetical protein A1O5_07946 [Cladophialophora psammophila CBS 110553]
MDSYRPSGENRRPYRDSDSYRPRHYEPPPPPWAPSNAGGGMYYFQGSRDREPSGPSSYRPRPDYRRGRSHPPRREQARRPPPPFPKTAANRPLLNLRHDDSTDSSLTDPNSTSKSKFRNVDELTDSEEEEMAQSEDEELDRPATKRARLNGTDPTVATTVPKWSNPDPYTALPPPAEATAKRIDVVKLIRKARIDGARNLDKVGTAHDFISLEGDEHKPGEQSVSPPPHPQTPIIPQASAPQAEVKTTVTGKRKRGASLGEETPLPRSDDQIYADRHVQEKWKATPGVDTTPWLAAHPPSDIPLVAFHKEIIDFYDWVKPKPHEEEVRGEVFQRLNTILQSFKFGELKAFGSYAAGLYLPTGDMDLVYLTRNFRPGRFSQEDARRLVYDCARFLRGKNVAQGAIVPIPKAKVPIIKFVDRISGLKIDLSFDNDTGVVAIDTFHKWRQEYPVMPIIVSVVKQYLMIRGLNDVSTGGLGGFSTICLVTSLLQHLPALKQPINLGDVLLEFFNYYGNLFDKKSVIIRLDPPGYLNKTSYRPRFDDREVRRLTIIDPHRADNNISGGTKEIDKIFKCFSEAYKALTSRLSAYERRNPQAPQGSFLECLIGGNFTLYDLQRKKLRGLCSNDHDNVAKKGGYASGVSYRPAVVDARDKQNDLRDESGIFAERTAAPTKKFGKGERRAKRLKHLRPDLAPSIRNTISLIDALKIGGYKTPEEMDNDLQVREAAAAKIAAARVK